jgi:predicted nucleic acid-binding Zn finger protein
MSEISISDNDKLNELLKLIKAEGALSEIAENEIISSFESRGEKAVKALRENKLHKLILNERIAIWEIEGTTGSYILIGNNYCECKDFQIRVLRRGEKTLCYHLLAKIIGEELQDYNLKKISNEDYDKLIKSKISE